MGVGGRGVSVPPQALSPPISPSLALPPSMRRRREGELPGVLRGELLAVLQEEKSQVRQEIQTAGSDSLLAFQCCDSTVLPVSKIVHKNVSVWARFIHY